MGANLLVAITIFLQFPTDSSTQPNPIQPARDTTESQPTSGLAFERLSDPFEYNRVQGLSLGIGYRLRVPGLEAVAMYNTVRYGFSDERITGRISLVREGADVRMAIRGYHDISDLDPFAPGRNLANTFNSLIAAHDNGDYAIADGGGVTIDAPLGGSTHLLSLSVRVERQRSGGRTDRPAVNDFFGGSGLFPPNPSIRDGVFGGLTAGVKGVRRYRWSLMLDLLADDGQTTARFYGDVRRSFGRRLLTVKIKAGAGTEPALPQTLFRLGGLHTIRGFEYGTIRSPAFWAAQLDLSPFEGRFRPVLFVDAGQGDRLQDLISSTALVGGGIGLSLFRGLVRLDFSRPISPDFGGKVRFDLVFQGVR
jgi:hypothetical protein